jgi:ASC-1-like (ASCH) protein
MSVALGDDCEFVIAKKTGRNRLNERSGIEKRIIMKSGDAIFFDGGCIPHEVKKILPNTAPNWWEKDKIENGSRCVILFREKVEDF